MSCENLDRVLDLLEQRDEYRRAIQHYRRVLQEIITETNIDYIHDKARAIVTQLREP